MKNMYKKFIGIFKIFSISFLWLHLDIMPKKKQVLRMENKNFSAERIYDFIIKYVVSHSSNS